MTDSLEKTVGKAIEVLVRRAGLENTGTGAMQLATAARELAQVAVSLELDLVEVSGNEEEGGK